MTPIVDLHCDLLLYLEKNSQSTIFDSQSRASFPQMKEGGVCFQTLAIFSETQANSSASGLKQIEIFKHLLQKHSECYQLGLKDHQSGIGILPAIENLSSLIEEDEPLSILFSRLNQLQQLANPLYLSLTWNSENRFGGGNSTAIGLKEDGKYVLDYLHDKKIAIDLSHTSDRLADEILNYLEQKNLNVIPIASHSNFRSIINHPRNLSNEIAKEIFHKKGIIGLNFVSKFLGPDFPNCFFNQIDHAISLGSEDSLCFGADFFCDQDSPNYSYPRTFFHDDYGTSACYPRLIQDLKTRYSSSFIEKISFINFYQFFNSSYARGYACLLPAI